ncbi:MAG TPA: cytochrome c [Acidimicrobiales bacterium]
MPAHVQAAQQRRRIPLWAMPVLAGLPLWGYVYVQTLEPVPVENDPLALGEEIYSQCSGCHGGNGAGQGSTPGFGEVAETWPDFRDHLMWVKVGAQGWPGETYGAQDKADTGVMPAFNLSDQELAQVVLYERQTFGEVDVEAEEPDLLAVANGEKTFAEVGLGELSEAAGFTEADLEG